MKKQIFDCEIELTEDMLGTVPKNKELYSKYIQSKIDDLSEEDVADELSTVPETAQSLEESGWTGFHVEKDIEGNEKHFVFNYFIKGWIKDQAKTCKEFKSEKAEKAVKQLRSKIVRFVHIFPRRIYLPKPCGTLERGMRVSTPLGERNCLARSDVIKCGTKLVFQIHVLGNEITKDCLMEFFDLAQYNGLGAWRTGGYGAFKLVKLELHDDDEPDIIKQKETKITKKVKVAD